MKKVRKRLIDEPAFLMKFASWLNNAYGGAEEAELSKEDRK